MVDGIVTVALVVFAIGCMDNVQSQIIDNPMRAALMLAVAYTINIVSFMLGAFMSRGNICERTTYGFPLANRNVGLVWAALGSTIDPTITLYFALTQVPIFTMPAMLEFCSRRIN